MAMGKPSTRHWSVWFHRLVPIVALVVFAFAISFIVRTFGRYSWNEIAAAMGAIPSTDLTKAGVLTILSYLVLACYDLMGMNYIGSRVRARSVMFTAFTAYAFGNNIGLSSLAGNSMRFRLYTNYGVGPVQILKVIAFVTTTFWLGFLSITAIAMLTSPVQLPDRYALSASLSTTIGLVALVLAATYVGACRVFHRPIKILGKTLELPRPRLALLQAATAAFDWVLAAGVLYFLLPHDHIGFFAFLSIFVSAQIVALVSNVPGGVGVLEALVIFFMSANHEPTPAILGGLVVYRLMYYIFPLLVAATMYVVHEVSIRRAVSN
jgi:phosphatidylglycerol lysyltransferase